MSLPDSILAAELRSARPAAPAELRARVLELSAREPQPARWRLPELRLRRSALVLVPAAVVVALGIAVAGGVLGSSSPPSRSVELKAALGADAASPLESRQAARGAPAGSLAPSAGRAQDYQAEMQLRVRDLSRTTKRALQLTRGLGGYIRTVDYGSGSEAGTATLVVRIPVGSVQAAIVRFSALGAIIDQHVSIRDIQPELDARFRQLQSLRARIATLQKRLANPKLAAPERRLLETRLAQERAELVALQRAQAQERKRASFATVSLALTSRKAAVVPSHPGRVERALDHAGSILVRELVVLVYVAVVVVPMLVLVLLLAGGERLRRRRSTERLLASR